MALTLKSRSTLSSTVDEDDLHCPVCHELLARPKILPCAHLACQECLHEQLRADPEAACPLCGCAIVAPRERGKRAEEVVAGLPTDLAMVAVVDGKQKLSEEQTCQACQGVPAASLCLNCGDMVCQECASGHLNMTFARSHTIERLDRLTPERLAASRPTPCAAHPDEPSRFFCPAHAVSVCHLCAAAKHRACTDVGEMEEKVNEMLAVLWDLVAALTAGEGDIDRALGEIDRHLGQAELCSRNALADVDATCDRLQDAVEAARRRMTGQILAGTSDEDAACGLAMLKARRAKLASHRRLLQRVMLTSPPSVLGEMAAALRARVNGLDRGVSLPMRSKVVTKATLSIDPQAVTRIEKELAGLGAVKVVKSTAAVQTDPLDFLRFHPNTGRNITLSNHRQTALRSGNWEYGIVVCCEPMDVNRVYEVRVDEIDTRYGPRGNVFTGVLTENPTTHRSAGVHDAWYLKSAYVIWDSTVQVMGEQAKSDVGEALTSVGVGSRVGVLLDGTRCLHLYVNGEDQGIAAHRLPQKCYALFDLGFYWKQLTGEPIRTLI